ncbi:MAG: hypothetical protein WAM58_18800 [Candidatus Acidiferrum sp.]
MSAIALVAKIGKSDDDAVDRGVFGAEQFGAAFGFLVSFHGAVFALLRRERDHVEAGILQGLQHFFAAGLGQMVRKKSPVPYNQPHCHFFLAGHVELREL